MQSTCPNPGCGAQYNLGPEYVGRHFVCRKCGSTLSVESDGLRMAGGSPAAAPAAPAVPAAAPYVPPASSGYGGRASAMGGQMLGSLGADLGTFVFGAGALLVILFMFFPLLDQFHASRLHAKARAKQAEYMRDSSSGPNESQRKEIKKMEEEADDQSNEAGMNRWRDGWGMLVGFLVLAAAAVMWLQPDQPKARKVVGGIIICAQLLLVFIVYVVMSVVSGMR